MLGVPDEQLLSMVDPAPVLGRLRLGGRFARHAIRALQQRWFDDAGEAMRAEGRLLRAWTNDARGADQVECPICGWRGAGFYPNVGPGFFEESTTCPGCGCQDRHRSLAHVLVRRTSFLEPHTRVVEVAPMRGFERWCLAQPQLDYVSFDRERHAMQKGDITNMRFASGSVDLFICFHVLEHIPDEDRALNEIRRVLRPGGTLVIQVPLDPDLERTVEYGAPDPRETNHVRRYGQDFAQRLEAHDFTVERVSVRDLVEPQRVVAEGLNTNDVYLARCA